MAREVARRRRRRRRALWPYLYALPAVAAMAFAFGYPLVQVVRDSFYAGNFDAPIYVAFDNYKGVINDAEFRQSLVNNLKLLLAVPVMLGLGLAIALVLNDRIRGMRKYQAIVFLPYVLPATAIGIAFSFLLQQNGVLNTALRDLHLGTLAHDWLGNSHLAIVSVGGLVIWQQLGFGVVVFTAALLALPPETAEAARIDGANWWQLQLRVLSRHAFLIVICLAALYPLYFIGATAIRSNAAYQLNPTGFPSHPTFTSLRQMILDEPLPRWMWNSFLVTLSSVAVSTLIALLAAYAAVFGRFWGHRLFLSTSVALMVVPPVTLLVPMFIFMVNAGFVNHLQSVIIFYTGLLVPFAVFFLANFFRTVPLELIEAASVE